MLNLISSVLQQECKQESENLDKGRITGSAPSPPKNLPLSLNGGRSHAFSFLDLGRSATTVATLSHGASIFVYNTYDEHDTAHSPGFVCSKRFYTNNTCLLCRKHLNKIGLFLNLSIRKSIMEIASCLLRLQYKMLGALSE